MAIPRAFSFYMNELTNYTKNTLKLISENTSDLGPGSVLRLRLPTNTIVNMRSLNFVFYVTTTCTTGYCKVQNAESLIKKAEWSCGGVNLSGSQLQEYDLLYHMLLLINGGSGFKKTRSILQNDDMLGMNSSLIANQTSQLLMIDDWFGFPNLNPYYIDTSILPQLELQITFNDPYCMAFSSGSATAPSFTLKNYYFTIETIQFNSPIYDEIMSAKLEAGEIIEIPYQDCIQYDTTNTGSIRFNINSHCISKILATNRAENYNTITQASVICRNGFTNRYRLDAGGSKTVVASTTANDCITAGGLFAGAPSTYGYRWSINGVSYPSYGPEHLAVGYSRLLDSFGDAASRYCQTSIPLESDKKSFPLYVPKIGWESATLGSFICTASATMTGVLITNSALIYVDSLSTNETTTTPSSIYLSPRDLYTNYNFIIPLDLGLETDGNERIQTGYNSLGGNSNMTLELGSSGITNSGNIISIFSLTQPKIRVGASQMIEVIR